MDRFEKYALLTLVLIVSIATIAGYIGFQVGGNAATDDTVDQMAGGGSIYSPFTIEPFGETGEYIGFFIAGSVGGFIVGYIVPSIFNSPASRREN